MYFFNKEVKRECLICFHDLHKDISLIHMSRDIPICLSCIKQLHINDHIISFHHYSLRILYVYDEFFQTLLYQYKGLYDIALKDVFLCLFLDELQMKYKDYIIVAAPSSDKSNEVRGFSPMEMIASCIHKNVFNGLYKKEEYKQSDLSFDQRKLVKDRIGIRNKEFLKNKKVLIIDDVITSSSTMETCLSLVKTCFPSKIELLVLSSSYW